MKVTGGEAACYRIKLREPWQSSGHVISVFELITARLRTDTGQEGVGWAFTVGAGGTAIAAFLSDDLLPRAAGLDPALVERAWSTLHATVRDAAPGGLALLALSAVDIALWDLKAQAAGEPLYRLLGGSRDRAEAYGSGINLNLPIPELLAQFRRWRARGFRAFKMKVGSADPRADLERVRAVREEIGPDALLMLDANQKWSAGEAAGRIRAFEPYDPYWIEEPLPAEDVAGHAWLRTQVRCPIALGENLFSAAAFNEFLRHGAVDVVQPDVVRVGGVTPFLKIAHLAEGCGIPTAPHLVLELSGQLCCAIRHASMIEDLDGGNLTELEALQEPIRTQDGYFTPPARPGHGVRFNWDALARWQAAPGPAGRVRRG
ncbi:MAG TPA: mandelate racemase/muconate lactonizing enzyme family protein [bacterium]|nr:mandelate racemase/muconate lactonizing enzyme family protein [bacterium]